MQIHNLVLPLFGALLLAGDISSQINSFPHVQTFDTAGPGTTPPTGWTNVANDSGGTAVNADWIFTNGGLPAPSSGPPTDFTDPPFGKFAYVEDAGEFSSVDLLSPVFDVGALVKPMFSVRLWSNSLSFLSFNALVVSVEDANDPDVNVALFGTGNIMPAWIRREFSIPQLAMTAFGDRLRIRFSISTQNNADAHDVAIDHFVLLDAQPFDLAVTSIVNPAPSCMSTLGLSEIVTVAIQNQGSTIQWGAAVGVHIFRANLTDAVEILTLPTPFYANDTLLHTLSTPANLFGPDATLRASVLAPQDFYRSNNSFTAAFQRTTISSFPHFEDFSAAAGQLPAGWLNDPNDSHDQPVQSSWITSSGLSSSVGPQADHTGGGEFLYATDDSDSHHVQVLSPCLDLSNLTAPTAAFWVHSESSMPTSSGTANTLHVDVLNPSSGILATSLGGPIGSRGQSWDQVFLDLSPWAGTTIQLRFRADVSNSGAQPFVHQLAIDDFLVVDNPLGLGQAPTPGEAVLDVNISQNALGFGVESGVPGPYYSVVSGSSSVSIRVSGVPDQYFAIVTGQLNPGVSPVPPLGQFDVGLPSSGLLPANLGVLVNGFLGGLATQYIRTNFAGEWLATFPVAGLAGTSIGLQGAIVVPGPQVARLTNAVELHFQ